VVASAADLPVGTEEKLLPLTWWDALRLALGELLIVADRVGMLTVIVAGGLTVADTVAVAVATRARLGTPAEVVVGGAPADKEGVAAGAPTEPVVADGPLDKEGVAAGVPTELVVADAPLDKEGVATGAPTASSPARVVGTTTTTGEALMTTGEVATG
jgi:hypothetical protein